MLADNHGTSDTNDMIPMISSPLASVSSGEASTLSSVGGASCPIVKLGVSGQVLMKDPDGMPCHMSYHKLVCHNSLFKIV